jgi:hypothetical protein
MMRRIYSWSLGKSERSFAAPQISLLHSEKGAGVGGRVAKLQPKKKKYLLFQYKPELHKKLDLPMT